jgi:3-hydroxybutyryl-CoA dehydrogenase
MKIEDIKKVLILGAGTMGQQIGLQCAMNGYEVAYYDISQDILDDAKKRVEKLASWYASTGRLTDEQLRQTWPGSATPRMQPGLPRMRTSSASPYPRTLY